MKDNNQRKVTTEEPAVELADVAAVIATTAVVGGVAALYATSDYNASGTGVSREFNLGGMSNGESVNVAGGNLTTEQHAGLDVGIFSTNQTNTESIGASGTSSAQSEETRCCGFFSSSKEQHESTGANGTTQGQSSETTCFGMTVSGSEETSCCASDNCCSYHYDLNCCGEGCVINISSTCCCAPLIDCCKSIGNAVPNLDDCGNCIAPVSNACESMTSCLPNLSQVGDCLSGAASQVGPALECIAEAASCLLSLIPSDD